MEAATKRVMVIDDEAIHRDTLEAILSDAGVHVTCCETATAALAMLRAGKQFDLILSDVVMPGMDGITFASEAKTLAPATPVILVTGRDSALDAVLAEGTVAIVKPYSIDTLRTIMAQHFDLSEW